MDQNLITIVAAAGTALATKGVEGPINSFNDLWYGALGHRIKAWSEVQKLKAFENYNKILEDMADNLNKIPQDNLKDPEISIVGPALEAAKYYCDEDDLRQMFSRLIASSMDNRISSKVHHSFVEVIKQLSPIDAMLLKIFMGNNMQPIADIMLNLNSGGSIQLFKYFFLNPNSNNNDFTSNAISISNLIRLGILNTPGGLSSFTDKSRYNQLESDAFFIILKNRYTAGASYGDSTIKDISLAKSYVGLTPYGSSFIDICIR